MKKIAIFDPSITTDNLGDMIIIDSIMRHLVPLYPHDYYFHIGTHDRLGPVSRKYASTADIAFVGGTNLLRTHWLYRSQWKIGLTDYWRIGHPVLMGVGWQGYQSRADIFTVLMLKHVLSKKHIHSVRDAYTENHLREIGINNVVNTACPTMWDLSEEHCASIPTKRAENALITVTCYKPAIERDKQWIELVLSRYKKVYFWPQMYADLEYIHDIAGDRIEVLDASLKAYDEILSRPDIDYVGTRLHGGIRALQHGRRALIIEVDNRATEIARDTMLPTMKREDLGKLKLWIDEEIQTKLTLPWDKIARWKSQFS